ncbi:unnamed protein product [Pleuronectes platessa]|uniref:Uncharacterized protein n=1 Tax=Pleuronectes platessa TaxID=8262 RepID=A0A9N7UHM5_PLEPL|nr:unnamed protein product [Pleuronectes platessa]
MRRPAFSHPDAPRARAGLGQVNNDSDLPNVTKKQAGVLGVRRGPLSSVDGLLVNKPLEVTSWVARGEVCKGRPVPLSAPPCGNKCLPSSTDVLYTGSGSSRSPTRRLTPDCSDDRHRAHTPSPPTGCARMRERQRAAFICPPVFTVTRADGVLKVARRAGRMLRGIPAMETFQFMKCANQGDRGGGGTEIRREWNSRGQGQTTSSGRRGRDRED